MHFDSFTQIGFLCYNLKAVLPDELPDPTHRGGVPLRSPPRHGAVLRRQRRGRGQALHSRAVRERRGLLLHRAGAPRFLSAEDRLHAAPVSTAQERLSREPT